MVPGEIPSGITGMKEFGVLHTIVEQPSLNIVREQREIDEKRRSAQ